MDKDLRAILERKGLPKSATEAEALEFFDRMSLEQKGHVGTEMAKRGWDKGETPAERLTTRSTVEEAATREITTRAFTLRAESADEENRSVEAVIATDDPVTVYDWRAGGLVDEVLRMDGVELPDRVPMLANHSRWSLDDVFGSARDIEAGEHEITGRLYFAEGDADAERAWQKVRGGHIRDVSAGYRAVKYTDIQPGQSAAVAGKTYTARGRTLRVTTRWQLREVSLVPIGADPRSKIRADHFDEDFQMNKRLRKYLESIGLRAEATEEEAQSFLEGLEGERAERAEALRTQEPEGGENRSDPPADPPADPPDDHGRGDSDGDPPADPEAIARRAIADERRRVRALEELAGEDVSRDTLQRAIHEGMTVERASQLFLEDIRRREPSGPAIHSRSRDRDTNARSLAAGFMATSGIDPTQHSMHNGRATPAQRDRITEQDADRGDEFRGMSTYDLVRECLLIDTGRSVRTVEQAIDALRASPSGATLSYVFSTNVYARLLEGWNAIGDTTAGWCDEEDVPNFLQQEDISLSASARLERLPRGGTANHATASDSHETYSIARYAKQFVVDEQDIIDDRLGAILRMPMEMGEAARQLRPDMVYSVMLQNPTMVSDSGAVFNSTAVTTSGGHANLGTGALSATTLKAGISAMVKQRLNRTTKDPGKQLNIRPRFLIVPAALEWTARELTASEFLMKLFADSSDPHYSQLNLIARDGLIPVIDDRVGAIGVLDPRTGSSRTGTDTNWFLTQGGRRGLRVAYRRGTNRQPAMRSFALTEGQWGLGWDINMDLGVAFTEWKTWYKSTGAG